MRACEACGHIEALHTAPAVGVGTACISNKQGHPVLKGQEQCWCPRFANTVPEAFEAILEKGNRAALERGVRWALELGDSGMSSQLLSQLIISNPSGLDHEWLREIRSRIAALSGSGTIQASTQMSKSAKRSGLRPKSKTEQKRESTIFGAIKAGYTGPDYCRELDRQRLPVPQQWIDQGCPPTYETAYMRGSSSPSGRPWAKYIQDEKYRYRKSYDALTPAKRDEIIAKNARRTRP